MYQHQDNYIQGDKVWFQYKDGLAWHRPGEVIYQKGNAVFIHGNGDKKKVAACKVKPYELKERKEESKEEKRDEDYWNKIIEEDERSEHDEVNGEKEDEQEVENEDREDVQEVENERLKYVIGAKYLKVEKSVCFLENSIYVVEVLVKSMERQKC